MIGIFNKFFTFSEDKKKDFYNSLIFSFFNSIFEAMRIPAIAIVLGAIIENNMTIKTVYVSLGIIIVSIVGATLMRKKTIIEQTIGGYEMCVNKRIQIGERLKYMPMGYFNENNLGRITSVTTNTIENIQDVATRVIQMYLQGIINTGVIALVLLFFDLRIGIIVICGMIGFMIVNYFMQKVSKRVSPQKTAEDEEIVEAVLEYVQGIGIVKSYNLGNVANKKVDHTIKNCEVINLALEKAFIPYQGLQTIVLKVFSVGIILASILFYINDSMTLLNCILMIISSFMIYAQLESGGMYSALLRIVDLSIDKVNEIINSPVMEDQGNNCKPVNFDIEAKNISFAYDERQIINDVSFKIPQNTTTAIIGPSGCGKSTLCHLISRFWDVNQGTITLGGENLQDYTLDSLLSNISIVFQSVYLFNDTIENNIKFGNKEATEEDVRDAATKANCNDFIRALPNGYQTVIGESGATLSGGEKQRISIARAMLKDAAIIILDEATANVDPENERALQEAIKELTKDKTLIMIAHRLKTVCHANQILVLNEGKIVQRGRHLELLAEGGIYANFINMREKAVGWKLAK